MLIYVAIVPGEPLFNSRDKFASGTGRPSYTRPLDPEIIVEKSVLNEFDDLSPPDAWTFKRRQSAVALHEHTAAVEADPVSGPYMTKMLFERDTFVRNADYVGGKLQRGDSGFTFLKKTSCSITHLLRLEGRAGTNMKGVQT